MRINSINPQTTFGRVVRLNTKAPQLSTINEIQAKQELENVLNRQESSIYSDVEADYLKSFFTFVLGDYDGEDGVLIKQTEDADYVISGREAEKINKLQEEIDDVKLQSEIYGIELSKKAKKAQKEIDRIIRKNDESGKDESAINEDDASKDKKEFRPTSVIEINLQRPIKKIDELKYFSLQQNNKEFQTEKLSLDMSSGLLSLDIKSEDIK